MNHIDANNTRYHRIPGSMSLLNCNIYQRDQVSRIADTELILLTAHLIQPPGSIAGVR